MSQRFVSRNFTDLPPLQPGQLRLYDNLLPKLKADTGYQVQITQIVDFPNYDKPQPPIAERTFQNSLTFVVEAPQFVLNGAHAVFSVSPASNQQGQFSDQLPHIVFTDPHLPWARAIDPGNLEANPGTPWLALLVFDQTDLGTGALPQIESLPITQIVNPPVGENVFRPVLNNVLPSDLSNTNLRINAIDIPTTLFTTLVPRLDELAMLAHVREVNPANKEEKLLFGDGRYSTIVGNRFPLSTSAGALNGCCLVSLEGFSPYLATCSGPALQTIAQPTVRLVVLASWQFTSNVTTISFANQMNYLSVAPIGIPPVSPPDGPVTPQDYVDRALTNGYVPLSYTPSWLGETTVGWYRGPFAPYMIEPVMPLHYGSSQAALIYDESTGFFDVSYAVAWQVGRLLAMSSNSYAQSLLKARRQASQSILTAAQRAALLEQLDAQLEAGKDAVQLARPHLVRELAHAYAAELLGLPCGSRGGPPTKELLDAFARGLDPVFDS